MDNTINELQSQRKLKVFLCHSSEDRAIVKELYDRLCNEESIDPWLDKENLLPGENWDIEIKRAVKEADIVLVCLSQNSISKEGYVQKEIRYALDIADEKPENTIFIIPVKIEECEIPVRLSRLQWVNYFEKDAYEKLLKSFQKRFENFSGGRFKRSEQRILTRPIRELIGHTFKPNSLAFSQDGKYLVSASDRVAIIWNTQDGKKIKRLQCDTWIGQAYFTRDDHYVIGIGGKGNFFQWDVEDANQVFSQKIHESDAVALDLSADGQYVASADKLGQIFLWKYPEMRHVKTFDMGKSEVRRVAFVPGSTFVLGCNVTGSVMLFDYEHDKGETIYLHPDNEAIRAISVSSDGNRVAFVDSAGFVHGYNLKAQTFLPAEKGHDGMALCCTFSAKGTLLASGGQDNKVVVWKFESDKLLRFLTIDGHTQPVISLVFEKRNNSLYSSSRDTKIKLWDIDSVIVPNIDTSPAGD